MRPIICLDVHASTLFPSTYFIQFSLLSSASGPD